MNQQRAREVFKQARVEAKVGPWSDQLRKVMTPEEVQHVNRVWAGMPGSTSFVDAFFRVLSPDMTRAERLAKDAFDAASAINCEVDDKRLIPSEFSETAIHDIESAISHLADVLQKIRRGEPCT